MITVLYDSPIYKAKLKSGNIFQTLPYKAFLRIQEDSKEKVQRILINGQEAPIEMREFSCSENIDLTITGSEKSYNYQIEMISEPLKDKEYQAYDQFRESFYNMEAELIDSIQLGEIKMYAVDQSTDVKDCTSLLESIDEAFPKFKRICDNPKSHLKSVNEVCPIETVKRVGHESIPYLASHSEDWLARTASGLKPARLFSRVEDDEYQIYENRVVKTLVDRLIDFLRKLKIELDQQFNQLNSIMSSDVQIDSFGFDKSFKIAVSELLVSDDDEAEYKRSESWELVQSLLEKTNYLLKKYRTLRSTRLYRYLKKTRPVMNPLNETNILMMDRNYNVIFKLWKILQRELVSRKIDETLDVDYDSLNEGVLDFFMALTGFTAHTLGFEPKGNNTYIRNEDDVLLAVTKENGCLRVNACDVKKLELVIDNTKLFSPIAMGAANDTFEYDGYKLYWKQGLSVKAVESFCNLHKKENAKKTVKNKSNEGNKKANDLKSAILEIERMSEEKKQDEIVIIPSVSKLTKDNLEDFKSFMSNISEELYNEGNVSKVMVAMPIVDTVEQSITAYAKNIDEHLMFLPISLFDINSYRRLQNVILRMIVSLKKDRCPSCGMKMKEGNDFKYCNDCGTQKHPLILKKTKCSNQDCKHSFDYLEYDVKSEVLEKMSEVKDEDFYQVDSMFQYKDIVNMYVKDKKLFVKCPKCGK